MTRNIYRSLNPGLPGSSLGSAPDYALELYSSSLYFIQTVRFAISSKKFFGIKVKNFESAADAGAVLAENYTVWTRTVGISVCKTFVS